MDEWPALAYVAGMERSQTIQAGERTGNGGGRQALDPIRRFEDLSRADVPYAGGKGANLGELTAAGLPVPGGFVVGAIFAAMLNMELFAYARAPEASRRSDGVAVMRFIMRSTLIVMPVGGAVVGALAGGTV